MHGNETSSQDLVGGAGRNQPPRMPVDAACLWDSHDGHTTLLAISDSGNMVGGSGRSVQPPWHQERPEAGGTRCQRPRRIRSRETDGFARVPAPEQSFASATIRLGMNDDANAWKNDSCGRNQDRRTVRR